MYKIYFHKLWLIMRLTTVILLAAFLQVSATTFAQRITINKRQVPLETVLKDIHAQSGYDFFFDRKVIKRIKTVNIAVRNATLDETMESLFSGLSLEYNIEGKIITIKQQKQSFLDKVVNVFSDINVAAQILNQEGKPLGGATVHIKGSQKFTTANESGEFSLTKVPEDAIIEISYVGYITLEVKASAIKRDGDLATVVMNNLISGLDQVQVIGYGANTKRLNVGSVTTISSAQLENQPVTNMLLALQGQVPGMMINSLNGIPGSKTLVQVRGQNTIKSSLNANSPYDQPLFIIDGVPLASQNENVNLQQSSATQLSNQNAGFSALNNLNIADIESISVLRDADATSIYGSQGANGVVLITTKKGKPGKTEMKISANTSVNAVTRQVQLLNTQQYIDLRMEALKNDGITLPATFNGYDYADLILFDKNKYTDWSDEFFGKTSTNTDLHLSLSGGTQNSTFILSGGYTNSNYNFPGDFADNRITFHGGFHHNSKDYKLNVDFGSDYSYDKNNSSGQPEVNSALFISPNFPDMLDADGNLIWNYKGFDFTGYQQYSYLKQPSNIQNNLLNNTVRVSYQLTKDFKISTNAGLSRLTAKEASSRPLSSQSPAFLFAQSSASFANSTFQTINIEPQLDYVRTFGKGKLTALLGGTYKRNNVDTETQQGSNYASDALLGSISGATTIYATGSSIPYKYVALFGRLGYVHDDKYIINLTGRRDGSSNFGPDRQFGNFGSLGIGWIFSEEAAFKTTIPFISYGKLSSNFGTNGSDGISAYQYKAYWVTNPNAPAFQGIKTYRPNNLYNPDYGWATKKSFNLALDLGFFKDRILLNATYYKNRESDQLIGSILPGQTGFSSVLENFNATVQNQGWEFTLSSTNIKDENFTWTTNFNLTTNQNKLISFPGLETSPYAQYYAIGRSTSIVSGYAYKGVSPTTGLFEFYKTNGSSTTNPDYRMAAQGGDKSFIADLQPKFFGGLGNTFSYKGISLSAFFQFAKQDGKSYLYSIFSNKVLGFQGNVPEEMLSHWRKPGDQSEIQKATSTYGEAWTAGNAFSNSSGAYTDASYIRLKTLSLSYNLPQNFIKKIGIKNCRVYVNGQNLFTITGYDVGDPETAGELSVVPMQRIISGGLSFNF